MKQTIFFQYNNKNIGIFLKSPFFFGKWALNEIWPEI